MLEIYKQQISNKTGFDINEILLMETEQIKEDETPYYYLFVYKGKRYRLIFDRLVLDR